METEEAVLEGQEVIKMAIPQQQTQAAAEVVDREVVGLIILEQVALV